MAQGAPPNGDAFETSKPGDNVSAVMHRSLHINPPQVVKAHGSIIEFSDGLKMLDSTCGAAVACLGYDNARVQEAMIKQIQKFCYINSMFYGSSIAEELATEVINGTQGQMSRVFFACSGSEAMEAAMKLARQYYTELSPAQSARTKFIARHGSYHGITLGALSLGGHLARRKLFEPMLMGNIGHVSPCYAYRGMKPGQSVEEYVQELAQELDHQFQLMGPETVCAFVAEPVVGAALGCVPAVPGYFQAMKQVCDKYGALLIFDEVMSGMGRCGSLHAWEQEGVVPDIQTIAKGIGGGYAPISGVLANKRVVNAMEKGSGVFSHGHTYQAHPASCAAALEVQRVIREERLVERVREMGSRFGQLLHEALDDHPHVGDIRGKGLFWGIEFVLDKSSKKPFPASSNVAFGIKELALHPTHGISLYPGTGTVDGTLGEHVILAPAYNITEEEMIEIVQRTTRVVNEFFSTRTKRLR